MAGNGPGPGHKYTGRVSGQDMEMEWNADELLLLLFFIHLIKKKPNVYKMTPIHPHRHTYTYTGTDTRNTENIQFVKFNI